MSSPESRRAYIVRAINEHGSVSVLDLSTSLDVSMMTVRRDLVELEKEGVLRRVHGGAVSTRGRTTEPPYSLRLTHSSTAKQRIGALAAELAAEGDKQKANEVLDYCMKALPTSTAGYDFFLPYVVEAYFAAGNKEKAEAFTNDISNYYLGNAEYYLSQSRYVALGADSEITQAIQIVSQAAQACFDAGETAVADKINKRLTDVYGRYTALRQIPK